MNSIKQISFLLSLILVTSSIFGSTKSEIINNTNKPIEVLWTAVGCSCPNILDYFKFKDKFCQEKVANANGGSAHYKFKGFMINLQVEVRASCRRNSNQLGDLYSFYCPSTGKWKLDGDDYVYCKLKGKGRKHVNRVVINDFNIEKEGSKNCHYRSHDGE